MTLVEQSNDKSITIKSPLSDLEASIRLAKIQESFWDRDVIDSGSSSKTISIKDWKKEIPNCKKIRAAWVDEATMLELVKNGFMTIHKKVLIVYPITEGIEK